MEPLKDAIDDRMIKDIVPPPHRPLTEELLYSAKCKRIPNSEHPCKASNTPNWEVLKNHLYREGRVSKEHCKKILKDTLAMISKET
jgi:serine/threonine-protein phosphatase 2B catalytic subunit